MTFEMNDRDVKSKWLKKYQEEMEFNREKQDREKNQRVLQEQEYLNKLCREMEEEKNREKERRKMLMQMEMDEYYKFKINKQKEEIKSLEDKMNKDPVSLEIGYEERLKRLKEHNNKLSENIDQNMNRYVNYQIAENKNDKYEEYLKNMQDYNQLNNKIDPAYNRKSTDIHQENNSKLANREIQNYNNLNLNLNNNIDPPSDDFLSKNFKNNYQEYKDLQKKVYDYNYMLMNNKRKIKENLFIEKKKTNDERLRELDKQHYMDQEEKLVKDQKQKIYRSLLDDQSKPYLRNSSMGTIGGNNNLLNVSSPNIQPLQNYGVDFYQSQVNDINNFHSTPVQVKSYSPILNNRKREFNPNPCKNNF